MCKISIVISIACSLFISSCTNTYPIDGVGLEILEYSGILTGGNGYSEMDELASNYYKSVAKDCNHLIINDTLYPNPYNETVLLNMMEAPYRFFIPSEVYRQGIISSFYNTAYSSVTDDGHLVDGKWLGGLTPKAYNICTERQVQELYDNVIINGHCPKTPYSQSIESTFRALRQDFYLKLDSLLLLTFTQKLQKRERIAKNKTLETYSISKGNNTLIKASVEVYTSKHGTIKTIKELTVEADGIKCFSPSAWGINSKQEIVSNDTLISMVLRRYGSQQNELSKTIVQEYLNEHLYKDGEEIYFCPVRGGKQFVFKLTKDNLKAFADLLNKNNLTSKQEFDSTTGYLVKHKNLKQLLEEVKDYGNYWDDFTRFVRNDLYDYQLQYLRKNF